MLHDIWMETGMISIHAPAWGATHSSFSLLLFVFISIHAPAWGATWFTCGDCLQYEFQSTLPRGERRFGIILVIVCSIFQSTLPRGERPRSMTCSCGFWHFNPRSRVGSDGTLFDAPPQKNISIHAPAWGATYRQLRFYGACVISIHAPAWGATIGNSLSCIFRKISIHAPAWGATKLPLTAIFQA